MSIGCVLKQVPGFVLCNYVALCCCRTPGYSQKYSASCCRDVHHFVCLFSDTGAHLELDWHSEECIHPPRSLIPQNCYYETNPSVAGMSRLPPLPQP